jgi:uncharacterized protein (DUF427 family)
MIGERSSDMKATWNGATIAQSDDTIVVEDNHYFPAESVEQSLLRDSATHTTCAWKGEASYKSLFVDGVANEDAAWYYPAPKEADYAGRSAAEFANRFAFWKGVTVEP